MSFTIRLLLRLALIILTSSLIHVTDSKKFIVPPFCLTDSSADSLFKLKCTEKQDRLFITLKQYSNDVSNYCNNSNKTTSASSANPVACHAYPTQRLASECNGKQECEVRLNQTTFLYGFMGSNCNFKADILFISYECIPTDYSSEIMPKYDICSGSADADSVIDRPVHGFIHSPSYPYAYQSGRFCQLTIRVDDSIERIEIFLIDMQLEGISQRNFKPTDYLQINSYEQLFGEKSFQVIYNETTTAVIKFKSDRWFNKRGFLLYFKAHKLPETTTSTTTTTTTTITTTATTSTSTSSPITSTNFTSIIPTLSVLQNETNPVNDSFSLTKSSSFASMSISDKSKETNNSFDLTNVKFLILMIIFGVLVGLVIFLLFSINKIKSYNTGTIDASKIQLTNRNSETVNLDYYLSNLDKSVGMITCNSIGFLNNTSSAGQHQQQPFYKLNYLKSMPNDSAAKLLINNNSSMNYTEPVIITSNSTTEVYEDINMDCFSKKDSLNRINENLKRQNEYHFIPSNLIKEDPVLKTTCANLANEVQPETLDAISSSYSSSMSSSDSLAFNSINNQMTSTPTAPKSMPPARTDPNQIESFGINENETKYEVETKVSTQNEYKSFLDSEIEYKTAFNTEINASVTLVNENEDFNTAKEDDYNYEYQIPSNLPANQSIQFNV